MSYQLRQDLSFCQIEGHVLCLDIQRDRYFRLPHAMGLALIAYINNHTHSEADFSSLIKHNILVETSPSEAHYVAPKIKCATRSALELKSTPAKLGFSTVLEVARLVAATKWQLKTRKLKNILERILVYRQKRVRALDLANPERTEHHLLNAASLFKYARAYVPIEPSCLLDSLAMIKFLARRQLPSSLVFGVTLEPFLAHCWIQFEDLLLNDMIGTTSTYTPIKII